MDTVKQILSRYAIEEKPVRICDMSGWQAVHRACEHEDTSCLQTLLEYDDTLVTSQTRDHTTPLIIAAGLGYTKTVEMLLPKLTAEAIACPNIHGLNALYYAVLCNTPAATDIAIKLINKNKDASNVVPYGCTYDCTPYRVVKTKNIRVLEAMINTGVSVDYDYYQLGGFSDSTLQEMLDNHKKDHILPGSTRALLPGCLLGYCVKFRWPEGLALLLETHKKRLEASPTTEPSFATLLNYEPRPGYLSPWALACLSGLTDCFKLMIDVGLSVEKDGYGSYSKPCRENRRNREPPLTLTMFPMSMAVHGKLFDKEEFLRYYFSQQNTEQFESFCEKKLLDYAEKIAVDGNSADLSRVLTFENPSYRSFHPLDSIASALTYCVLRQNPSEEGKLHIVTGGIKLLLDCGFSFDFRHIVSQYGSTLCYQNTVSRLLQHSKQGNAKFLILIELMRQFPTLPISPDAIHYATELCGQGILIPSLFGVTKEWERKKLLKSELSSELDTAFHHPHLYIIQQLCDRGVSERQAVFSDIFITRNTVCHRLHPINKKTVSQRSDSYNRPNNECCWFPIAQLIMKGVEVCYDEADSRKWKSVKRSFTRPKTVCYPRVPFSLVVLDDDEGRRRFLDDVLEGVDEPNPQELAWREERVSSLQCKCRAVIRHQIGGARLMYEPVPRDESDVYKVETADWETSFIDQLPIPKLFRPFLKYLPEISKYSDYYKSFKTERHWI